jgi:hypothetical protein
MLQGLVLRPFVSRLFALRRLPVYTIPLFARSYFQFKALWLFNLRLFKPFFVNVNIIFDLSLLYLCPFFQDRTLGGGGVTKSLIQCRYYTEGGEVIQGRRKCTCDWTTDRMLVV